MKQSVIFFTSILLSTAVHGANITFFDSHVKSLCVQYWDKDKDGELSEEEAAAITSLSNVFSYDDEVVGFEELVYFTGLSKISANDFYNCKNLTYVKLPPQVTSIGNCGFYGCSNLSELEWPKHLERVGIDAFAGCAFREIILPGEVELIFYGAFSDCENLTYVELPRSLKYIAPTAFSGCGNVTLGVYAGSVGYDFAVNAGLSYVILPE